MNDPVVKQTIYDMMLDGAFEGYQKKISPETVGKLEEVFREGRKKWILDQISASGETAVTAEGADILARTLSMRQIRNIVQAMQNNTQGLCRSRWMFSQSM